MNVIYPFSQDCIELLQQLNENKKLNLEYFYVGLVLLFCNSKKKKYYNQKLLYPTNNICTTIITLNGNCFEINDEVLFYLNNAILYRPISSSSTNRHYEPNKTHQLLSRFCYLHINDYWQSTTVARYPNPQFIESQQLSFKQLQNQLRKLKWQKTEHNEKYGAIYLTVAQSGIKLPEELCLAHIIDVCLKPLKMGFQQDSLFEDLFTSVIEQCNAYYGLLVSCRLTPQIWLNKNVQIKEKRNSKPLANWQLEDLKQLRELAMQTDEWKNANDKAAYQIAFAELLAKSDKKTKTVAQFHCFEQWCLHEIGQAMLNPALLSIEEINQEYSDTVFDDASLAEKPCFAVLVEIAPHLFSPLMAYLFNHIFDIPNWRQITAQDKTLKQLIINEPRYANLSGKKLNDKLWHDAEKFLLKHKTYFTEQLNIE
ncbi:MAG: hypothetical protein WAX77_02535 [Methylococcaceae bacterium]